MSDDDEIRDGWMTTQGLNVLRFTVHEVLENIEEVKERIWAASKSED